MTHATDETLSAMLDDEAVPPDDVAHVERCLTCRERMEQLRAVTVALRAQTPLPAAHLREAAVAVALDERPRVGVIRRLRPARREDDARPAPPRRMTAASAAAALVVALAVGGWALTQVGNSASNTTNDPSVAALDSETNSAATVGADAFGTGGAASGFYDAGDLGEFTDAALLEARFQEFWATPEQVRTYRSIMTKPSCPSDHSVYWHATLTFTGVAAYARAVTVSETTRLLQVQRRSDCAELATRTLEPTNPR